MNSSTKNTLTDAEKQDRIRQRAHAIWEREGRPDGQHDEHWFQAARELEGRGFEVEGDDVANLAAIVEAAREHQDTYMVSTDLEDSDQRSIPGTREQP